ncbi:MAG: tyrosine-type recombinase/integrase, partial [Planctomycetes bacterium]|nr:tyrosine-type recombinase/integrase [Planctomycetota bacterium]
YLRAIKSLTRWMCRDKRTPDDALVVLNSFNEATDPRHVRRELTQEEMAYLLPIVEGYTHRSHNLSGPERAMAYRIALGTGFRADELRSLTPASFGLDADPPTITVEAAYSKRRRRDIQPIRRDLAKLLLAWLDGRLRNELVFAKLPGHTARMLRGDMKTARKTWIAESTDNDERARREKSDFLCHENEAGEVVDFHSTRHTYISGIVASGASIKTAQELARHSTSTLTIDRYAHARLHDIQGALEALPGNLDTPADEPNAMRATGTDDTVPANRQQLDGKQRQNKASDGERTEQRKRGKDTCAERPNVLPLQRKATVGERWREAEGMGLEPTTACAAPDFESDAICPESLGNTPILDSCQQIASSNNPSDADLALICERWRMLPEAIKTGIVAMVKAANE